MFLFQIWAELQRILGVDDCCKNMKNAFLEKWKSKLLMLLKQTNMREVQNLPHIIEDSDLENEQGNLGNVRQNVSFKLGYILTFYKYYKVLME